MPQSAASQASLCYSNDGAVPLTLRRAALLSSLVFLALVSARPVNAHPTPFSYINVRLGPARVDISVVVHAYDVAHELGITPTERLLERSVLAASQPAIARLLNERLRIGPGIDGPAALEWTTAEALDERQSLTLRAAYALKSAPGVLTIHAAMFPYDPRHQTFVNVYEGDRLVTQAILDTRRTRFEHFAGTMQGRLAVVQRFIGAGIHHILIGPDHLLFLVGLLLLGGSVRRLVLVVSAFTLAHSVTLSLAALAILRLPSSIVEPAIALSIVFVGVDNLMAPGGRDLRTWIAFGFGFLHGFGFAAVLSDMGLANGALGWSLFSFNLGVEIGQLLVVVVVASLLAFLRARNEQAGRRLVFAGSIGVIAAGTFWFIERVLRAAA